MRTGEVYLVFLEKCGVAFCAIGQDSLFLYVCVITPPNRAPNMFPTANLSYVSLPDF